MTLAAERLHRDPDALAVVARLIVDPTVRRRGAGRALLETAAAAAHAVGRHPILDVVTEYDAANRLYASCGWANLGEVEMVFRDGTRLRSYVYAGPSSV
jgi:GNAT superfamily N-acetyltransferase